MMSRHFGLSSELTGAIAKKLPHAKNQLSGPDSFFNQFVTDTGYGQFVTRTVRYGQFVTGYFVTRTFRYRTLRYMDSSLHGYFNMKSLRKQTIF